MDPLDTFLKKPTAKTVSMDNCVLMYSLFINLTQDRSPGIGMVKSKDAMFGTILESTMLRIKTMKVDAARVEISSLLKRVIPNLRSGVEPVIEQRFADAQAKGLPPPTRRDFFSVVIPQAADPYKRILELENTETTAPLQDLIFKLYAIWRGITRCYHGCVRGDGSKLCKYFNGEISLAESLVDGGKRVKKGRKTRRLTKRKRTKK